MHRLPGGRIEIVRRGTVTGAAQKRFNVCQAELAFVDGLEALPGGQILHHTHDQDGRLLPLLEYYVVLFYHGDAIRA